MSSIILRQNFKKVDSLFLAALLTEDFCGVEPVTLPPIEKETRPPPLVDEDRLRSYDGVNAGFLASKFV